MPIQREILQESTARVNISRGAMCGYIHKETISLNFPCKRRPLVQYEMAKFCGNNVAPALERDEMQVHHRNKA